MNNKDLESSSNSNNKNNEILEKSFKRTSQNNKKHLAKALKDNIARRKIAGNAISNLKTEK
jgi:hypothetical protein